MHFYLRDLESCTLSILTKSTNSFTFIKQEQVCFLKDINHIDELKTNHSQLLLCHKYFDLKIPICGLHPKLTRMSLKYRLKPDSKKSIYCLRYLYMFKTLKNINVYNSLNANKKKMIRIILNI